MEHLLVSAGAASHPFFWAVMDGRHLYLRRIVHSAVCATPSHCAGSSCVVLFSVCARPTNCPGLPESSHRAPSPPWLTVIPPAHTSVTRPWYVLTKGARTLQNRVGTEYTGLPTQTGMRALRGDSLANWQCWQC